MRRHGRPIRFIGCAVLALLLVIPVAPVAANGGPWVITEDATLTEDHYGSMVVVPPGNVEAQAPSVAVAGGSYAVIHYLRDDGDYGDHTTGDYNDYWGLHAWGDIDETIEWTAPKPFLGEDEYGRFAWLKLQPGATNVGFIVHRGDTKDGTDADRFFDPSQTPEIWLKQDEATTYTSQAAAQGFATVHYQRADGDYTDWGLHLWGFAIGADVATDWNSPRPPDGTDDFGAYWKVPLQDATQPLNFIVHRGDEKDPGPDQAFIPAEDASKWVMSGDETLYAEKGGALGFATLHYRRLDGDYGDYSSSNYNDYWGLHTWLGAEDPGWTTPRTPAGEDVFGPVFEIELSLAKTELGYILHRGDEKDPGPDQVLNVMDIGYEVWQLQGADPAYPYLLPMVAPNEPPVADPNGPYLGAMDAAISFDGSGSSDPEGDTLTYDWDWGDTTTAADAGATPSHTYAAAGIYDVCLTVTDPTGASDDACTSAVVYDPSGGFVSGGGWIDSPAGAYLPDMTMAGRATFRFVSRYQKGADAPTGNTAFVFQAADLNFHASSYDWLVVTGNDYARYKGTGTINGNGEYKFMLWVGDNDPDTFRIKIWSEDAAGNETVVYDNGTDQTLGGGSIVVHAK